MGKTPSSVVVYAALAVLFLLLLLSSKPPSSSPPPPPPPPKPPPRRSQNRRLKLRSPSPTVPSSSQHAIPFDPIVADIERKRDDRRWEREHYSITPPAPAHESQPEWGDFMDAEDYINDEKRFNVTDRLVVLFPSIDLDPADGFLTVRELTQWNVKQAVKEAIHRSKRDMEIHDKNKDGFVSFREYEPPAWVHRSDDKNSSVGWWKEDHFNASDMDGDGLLNLTEFNDFLHPADSGNPKLINWLCKEEIRERDTDKDGKLNFQEFFHGLFDSIQNYNETHDSSHESDASAKKLFAKLDQDNDGFLSEEEIKPVLDNLHPSDHYYAKQQAEHTISEADTDKDGRLSLKETIENPYVFYSAIFDDEDDDYYHEELR